MISVEKLRKKDSDFVGNLRPKTRGFEIEGVASKCWEFNGPVFSNGYGRVYKRIKGKLITRAHRYSYLLVHGKIAKGLSILHKCDNKLCCNPNHLEEGDHTQNMIDMTSRNRQAKGSSHAHAVFVEADVAFIRLLLELGFTYTTIAELFDSNKSTISKLNYRSNWKHVVALSADRKTITKYIKSRVARMGAFSMPVMRNTGSSSDSKHTTVGAIRAFVDIVGQTKTAEALNSTRKKIRILLENVDATEVEVSLASGNFHLFSGPRRTSPATIIELLHKFGR